MGRDLSVYEILYCSLKKHSANSVKVRNHCFVLREVLIQRDGRCHSWVKRALALGSEEVAGLHHFFVCVTAGAAISFSEPQLPQQ